MNNILNYTVEIRDKEGKIPLDFSRNKVDNYFTHKTHELSEYKVKQHCESLFDSYNDTWRTVNINIEVTVWSEISSCFMTLYSFYGAEKRFIKH